MIRRVGFVFFIIILVLSLALLIVTFSAPAISSIEVEKEINAPIEKVWPLVSTFENRNDWNPFLEGITELSTNLSGTDGEIGTIFSWTSKQSIGSQTITESIPNQRFASDLYFQTPFEGSAKESTTVESISEDSTMVKWTYTQSNDNFIEKLFVGLGFFKKVMTNSYESGLTKLKGIAENQ